MLCVDLSESFQTHIFFAKFGFDTAENEPLQVRHSDPPRASSPSKARVAEQKLALATAQEDLEDTNAAFSEDKDFAANLAESVCAHLLKFP